MKMRLLKKDLLRNKVTTATLFLFMTLAAALLASATSTLLNLSQSLEQFFVASNAPHFVQMHAGEMDQTYLDRFSKENPKVKQQQTVAMINIEGSNIFLGNKITPENNSVMDISLVKQNTAFDYLLDLHNKPIHINDQYIGVPIYYQQKHKLQIGDTIRIAKGSFEKTFTISDFVRDIQMNPAIISSKRFVISQNDFDSLQKNFNKIEYLIEFQLHSIDQLDAFTHQYTDDMHLPQKGPTIDYALLKTLNGLTDGMVIAIVVLISVLIIMIKLLCLRFTILAAIEEEYRDIGIMKAIGINWRHIRNIYLQKYSVMSLMAAVTGFLLSIFISQILSFNIFLYMGTTEPDLTYFLFSLFAALLIFMIVTFACRLILRGLRNITALSTLQSNKISGAGKRLQRLSLYRNNFVNIHFFLAFKDLYVRFNQYILFGIILMICTLIMIIPMNFLTTINSPNFIQYMGTGNSDIRIDIQHSDLAKKDFERILSHIKMDKAIEKYSYTITARYNLLDENGGPQSINIEHGDFNIFPVKYTAGHAPINPDTIALSHLNAQSLNKTVGDAITLLIDGSPHSLQVTGIYPDITNGGKTAKAQLAHNDEITLWYIFNLDLINKGDITKKISEYTTLFSSAKVTDIREYMTQTLGTTIKQVNTVTTLTCAIALILSILITALFLKMLLAKDASDIIIMRSLGFASRCLQMQYIIRLMSVLAISMIIGSITANILGEGLVGLIGSKLGAPHITFEINPFLAYMIFPLILTSTVSLTTLLCAAPSQKLLNLRALIN